MNELQPCARPAERMARASISGSRVLVSEPLDASKSRAASALRGSSGQETATPWALGPAVCVSGGGLGLRQPTAALEARMRRRVFEDKVIALRSAELCCP